MKKENLKKPDNPFWAKVGNWCIYFGIPVSMAVIELFVPSPYKEVLLPLCNSLLLGVKAATKFTTK